MKRPPKPCALPLSADESTGPAIWPMAKAAVTLAARGTMRSTTLQALPIDTLLEALRGALPIVASAVDGIPEDVSDGESALLVPPGDAAPLAAALREMVGRLEASPRRVAYDLSRFSGDLAASRIEDFYRRVIGARRSRRPAYPESLPAPVPLQAAALPRKKASHG